MNAQTLVRRLNLSWFELNDPEKRALVVAEILQVSRWSIEREYIESVMDELAQEMVR